MTASPLPLPSIVAAADLPLDGIVFLVVMIVGGILQAVRKRRRPGDDPTDDTVDDEARGEPTNPPSPPRRPEGAQAGPPPTDPWRRPDAAAPPRPPSPPRSAPPSPRPHPTHGARAPSRGPTAPRPPAPTAARTPPPLFPAARTTPDPQHGMVEIAHLEHAIDGKKAAPGKGVVPPVPRRAPTGRALLLGPSTSPRDRLRAAFLWTEILAAPGGWRRAGGRPRR